MSKKDYTEAAIGEPAESQKIFCMINKYTQGKKGLDIGCGGWKITGSVGIDIRPGAADIVDDATKGIETIFKKARKKTLIRRGLDYIFSSHLLEDFDIQEQMMLLKDWISHLKVGGHLILYVPEKGQYKGCNQAHKHEFEKGELKAIFEKLGLELTDRFVESEAGVNGYSILIAGKKIK